MNAKDLFHPQENNKNHYPIIGNDFDYQVRMDQLQFKQKLGEGGFGEVYLAYDNLSK